MRNACGSALLNDFNKVAGFHAVNPATRFQWLARSIVNLPSPKDTP